MVKFSYFLKNKKHLFVITSILNNFLTMKIRLKTFLLFLIISKSITAQNQYPPDIKWKRTISDKFEIVFPSTISKKGLEVSNTMNKIYRPVSSSLKTTPKPISLFLNTTSAYSNGYVTFMPRHSVFYTTPPQDSRLLGNGNWLNMLALHEYRHVVQNDLADRHFTRFCSFLFGDIARVALRWSHPTWYAEGDAICSETLLSKSGRGRVPEFQMPIRTHLLSGNEQNYYKAYLGSYKTYTPGAYELGYLLTAFTRREHGKYIWHDVVDRTSKYSFWPFAFSRSMKKITGSNVNSIYKNAMKDLKPRYQQQDLELNETNVKHIATAPKKVWTNYRYPQATFNQKIIALKTGLADASVLVSLKNGKETRLTQVGASKFSVGDKKICWAVKTPDIRWQNQSFSEIWVYDLGTKKPHQLTFDTKYFAPAMSKDDKTIACIEYTENLETFIVLLNSDNGKVIQRVKHPENDFIRMPSWSYKSKKLVFTHSSDKGQAISVLDVAKRQFTKIKDYTRKVIGQAVFFNHFILYHSSYSGLGAIYAIDTHTHREYQVCARKYGAYNPSVKDSLLVFEDYSAKGYKIGEVFLNPKHWIPLEKVKVKKINYHKPLLKQEQVAILPDSTMKHQPPTAVSNYPKLKNAVNIHSCTVMPWLSGAMFQLMSDNKLNTTRLSAGLGYDFNENAISGLFSAQYSGFFPVLSLSFLTGERNVTYKEDEVPIKDSWYENSLIAGARIPLNLSKNAWNQYFSGGINYAFTHISSKQVKLENELYNGHLSTLHYFTRFSRYKHSARRDVAPRLGQTYRLNYEHSPFHDYYKANLFSFQGTFYFPGLFKHHSLQLRTGYEYQHTSNYYFPSNLIKPRGYEDIPVYQQFVVQSIAYRFPLAYPEWAWGPILYFKRFRGGFAYDFGYGHSQGQEEIYQSIGLEFGFDFHLFSLPYELKANIRTSYLISEKGFSIDLIFSDLFF